MTLREKIEVMQAFERGEEIEVSYINIEKWSDISTPDWAWSAYDYRIKPKPKQVVVIEKWLVTNGKRFDVVETVNIDAHIGEVFIWTKVKLIDTYEVTL